VESYYIERENENMARYNTEFFIISTPFAHTRLHIHSAIELLYIRQGQCSVTLNDVTVEAHVGDVVLCRSNVIHSITSDAPIVYDVLKLHPTLVYDFFAGEDGLAPFFLTGSAATPLVFRTHTEDAIRLLWKQMLDVYQAMPPYFMLSIRSLAAQLLLSLLAHHSVQGAAVFNLPNKDTVTKIDTIIRYMDENFGNTISAESCAKMLYMSYSHFARCFKSVTGKTFKQYLTDLRILRAENMLLSGEYSITEIATRCGYDHTSYFIQEFKRRKQITPLQYRALSGAAAQNNQAE